MDFADQIRELAASLDKKKDFVCNEEETKQSMVMPFLQVLGYDIFDPLEVRPEYTADIGIKKGEKVDYGIAFNNEKEATILIEVKRARTPLYFENISQLYRYFGATRSKFAILTNGIKYQFYSDLDDKNKMDKYLFFTVDLIPSIRDSQINELRKFHKDTFDTEKILSSASDLKYIGELKRYLKEQIKTPDELFTKFFIKRTSFSGTVHKQSLERFSTIVSTAFRQYVNEMVTDITNLASEEAKKIETGEIKETLSERDSMRQRFWTQLLAFAKTKTDLHSRISPGKDSWCGMGAGTSGLGYNYVIFQHQTRVELYIDKGEHALNKEIFDKLLAAKEGIEQTFGGPLEWERKDERRACRIKKDLPLGGYRDNEQNWPKIHETMVDAMMRLHNALNPHIQYLRK